MRNRFRAMSALFVVAAALAGCATTDTGNRSVLPATIQAEDGVLMVKVIGVQPLSAFNAKWNRLKITERSTGRATELRDTAPPAAGYSLFVGPVPKGQYSIAGFSADGQGPATFGILPALIIAGMTSDNQQLGSQLGTFSVRSGELVNLGLIISALPDGKGSAPQIAVLADDKARAANLADVDAAARTRLQAMQGVAWDQPQDADASNRALAIVRTRARNVSTLEVADGERVLIGSALGMVHVRDAQGQWSSMSTGSLDNITYVRALRDGRLFAGTDSGRYFVWLPTEKAWKPHDIGTSERITQLEPMGDAGFALMVNGMIAGPIALPTKNRVLFVKDLDGVVAPRELINLPDGSAVGRLPMFFDGHDLLVYFNHVGISRTADLHRVDAASLQTRIEKVDHWAVGDYWLPGGTRVHERMNGMTVYTDFSDDNGKTWTHNETAGPYAMRFADRTLGYGVSVASTGWSTVTLALNKTVDGGRAWQRIGLEWLWRIKEEPTVRLAGKTLFVFTGRELLSTTNEGQSWKVEWPMAN